MNSLKKIQVTSIIITRNEELNIEKCLKSIHGFVDQIFVIDSESTDSTRKIASQYADEVRNLPYDSEHIGPWIFQWGLDNLPIRNEWVLILEADQVLTPELKNELLRLYSQPSIEQNGFYIKRRQIFRGKPIRFGGYGSKYLLKLFRRSSGELDKLEQDTRVYVKGLVGKLRYGLDEDNKKEQEILFYLQKHIRYANMFANEESIRRTQHLQWKLTPRLFGSPDEYTLWLKGIYYRSPLMWRPFFYFFYRYILLLGFLDGKQGFIFHFMQAFWFRLIVDIRLEELIQEKK